MICHVVKQDIHTRKKVSLLLLRQILDFESIADRLADALAMGRGIENDSKISDLGSLEGWSCHFLRQGT